MPTPKLPACFLITRTTFIDVSGLTYRDCLRLEEQKAITPRQIHKRRRGAHRGGTIRYLRSELVKLYPSLD